MRVYFPSEHFEFDFFIVLRSVAGVDGKQVLDSFLHAFLLLLDELEGASEVLVLLLLPLED
jgi:hypothetical protein